MIFEDKKGYKVEECCPGNCLKWCQYFGRNYSGYTIGCIMETIDVIENECEYDNDYQKCHRNLLEFRKKIRAKLMRT
jgi:hypothetical protein